MPFFAIKKAHACIEMCPDYGKNPQFAVNLAISVPCACLKLNSSSQVPWLVATASPAQVPWKDLSQSIAINM